MSELRLRKQIELGGDGDTIITNGFLLNNSFRNGKLQRELDITEWDEIKNTKIQFPNEEKYKDNKGGAPSVTKFRCAMETEKGINELASFFSESYGMRVRKNFIVKMLLKRELLRLISIEEKEAIENDNDTRNT